MNDKYQTRCVSRELTVRMEERLLHFMRWLEKQKGISLYSMQERDFQTKADIEKFIIEYVEG